MIKSNCITGTTVTVISDIEAAKSYWNGHDFDYRGRGEDAPQIAVFMPCQRDNYHVEHRDE